MSRHRVNSLSCSFHFIPLSLTSFTSGQDVSNDDEIVPSSGGKNTFPNGAAFDVVIVSAGVVPQKLHAKSIETPTENDVVSANGDAKTRLLSC